MTEDTALQTACRGGHYDIAELLLYHGADIAVNWKNGNGCTALGDACRKGHRDIVELLLDHGANIEITNPKFTNLMFSCLCGHTSTTKLLLDRGASTYVRNLFGDSALHIACWSGGNISIVKLLLEHGCDINAVDSRYSNSPLHVACSNGHTQIVEELVARGADITLKNRDGQTPFFLSKKRNYHGISDLLTTEERGGKERSNTACNRFGPECTGILHYG
jgi:ankyrin repeat protein